MSLEQMRKDIANVVYICERLGKTIETYQAVYDDKKQLIKEKDDIIYRLIRENERLREIISQYIGVMSPNEMKESLLAAAKPSIIQEK